MSVKVIHVERNKATGKEVKVCYDTFAHEYIVKPTDFMDTWYNEDTEKEAIESAKKEAGTYIPLMEVNHIALG